MLNIHSNSVYKFSFKTLEKQLEMYLTSFWKPFISGEKQMPEKHSLIAHTGLHSGA